VKELIQRGALHTAEDGDNLVEVALAANRAELELAARLRRFGEGWAGEPHECQCDGPDDSCPACSSLEGREP
jgi:hypothetical protein